jgi:hypothetical protein
VTDGNLLGRGQTAPVRGPLLVLGAGQRTGSTLLQRLLSSHPDVHIWGEHDGHIERMLTAAFWLRRWSETKGKLGRLEFAAGGYQSFMANLTPEASRVDNAMRQFLEVLYADPALKMGRKVWGFKEVRYGQPEAREIHRLFAETQVIHVIRDPRDMLRSLDAWERTLEHWQRDDTLAAVGNWQRVTSSFLGSSQASTPPVLRLRYEDVVTDPAMTAARVGEFTGLDPGRFDMAVFARKIHDAGPGREGARHIRDWDELPESLRALLGDDRVQEAAAACGYLL